jgi:hypothetical protein
VRYEVGRIEHLGPAMPAADLDDALRRREEEPDATGSNVTGDTIAIVRVPRRAASTACVLAATMTSTLSATSSPAGSASRSTLPSALRSPT